MTVLNYSKLFTNIRPFQLESQYFRPYTRTLVYISRWPISVTLFPICDVTSGDLDGEIPVVHLVLVHGGTDD